MNHSAGSRPPREHKLRVLLVDDQVISGEYLKRSLASLPDLEFKHCLDPAQAVQTANQFNPTVILQDLVMPDIDGLMLVKFFRANPATRDTPMIVLSGKEEAAVKAEAFARGANDYLVKWPEMVELVARIRYHSRAYIHLLERNEGYAALAASQKHLAAEIAAGAAYVQSLLPAPMKEPIDIDWRYTPCAELAGDSLGYHFLDADHLALYLLDVTGHGLASALLGVTVMNVLRAKSLPDADFRKPGEVLGALNKAFPMENHDFKCFTIWYGVWHLPSRTLHWSGGGHPAALLFSPDGDGRPVQLESTGPVIGIMEWPEFEASSREVPPGSRLYVYSDGAHEIHLATGGEWRFEDFLDFMSQPADGPRTLMDRLLSHVRQIHGGDILDDDFTVIEAKL
ncbi:MAG TPA: SpoIIE family protein phosphatase [Pirellulaceae bacterium]|nr:SpoIIE family protein phosphatase [Pirellulaceae bacterium]